MTEANTLFLRLEGPLQAWGDTSKFVIRRTMDAPTKSGVLGLLCCAMGLSREKARERLPELNGWRWVCASTGPARGGGITKRLERGSA